MEKNNVKPKKKVRIVERTEDPLLASRYRRFLLKEVSRHLEEIKMQELILDSCNQWNKQEQDDFWSQISYLREAPEPEELPLTPRDRGLSRRSTCVSLGRSVRFENIDY